MYLGRKCQACGNTRIPEQQVVAEKKVKYVIYKCTICKMQDIERYDSVPHARLWNGATFEEGPGYNDSFFDTP